MSIRPLIKRILFLFLYVVLASFDMEPASKPMRMNGMITPMLKTRRIAGKASGDRTGNIAKKIGAMQGSRK